MTGLEFKAIAYVMAYTGTSFTTAKVIVYGATLLTAGYVGSRIAEQKAKEMQARMRQQAQNRAIEVQNMQFGTSAPRRFIYGETQVNGHLIFQETAGSSNKDLYRVVYLGEGPINNAQDVYFDDKHTLSQSNNLIFQCWGQLYGWHIC